MMNFDQDYIYSPFIEEALNHPVMEKIMSRADIKSMDAPREIFDCGVAENKLKLEEVEDDFQNCIDPNQMFYSDKDSNEFRNEPVIVENIYEESPPVAHIQYQSDLGYDEFAPEHDNSFGPSAEEFGLDNDSRSSHMSSFSNYSPSHLSAYSPSPLSQYSPATSNSHLTELQPCSSTGYEESITLTTTSFPSPQHLPSPFYHNRPETPATPATGVKTRRRTTTTSSTSSSSSSVNYTRAPRKSLKGFTEEMRKDRIRQQNNQASARYRGRNMEEKSKLRGDIQELRSGTNGNHQRKESLDRFSQILENLNLNDYS